MPLVWHSLESAVALERHGMPLLTRKVQSIVAAVDVAYLRYERPCANAEVVKGSSANLERRQRLR